MLTSNSTIRKRPKTIGVKLRPWFRDYYFGRSIASPTVHDGLVYAVDLTGCLFCLDAKTGKAHWVEDLRSSVWGQPLWVDGRVYIRDGDGTTIFEHGKQRQQPVRLEGDNTYSPVAPIFANGTLYITTDKQLYAVRKPK